MEIAITRDILYVETTVYNTMNLADKIRKIISKSQEHTIQLELDGFRYNWVNTILKDLEFEILVPLNPQFILKINDCTVESVYRGENVTLATFAFKSSEVKKTEDTDWGLPNKRVRC